MEEPDDVTGAFLNSTRFWIQHVFVPFVTVLGVAGNLVTISILTQKQIRLSANVYLTALAISDTLFLVFSFSMAWKHYEFMKSVRQYWNYIPVGLWLTDASSSSSVWLTVSFTIERYMGVCHPLPVRAPLNVKRSTYICGLVYILCFLSTASTSFEWKANSVHGDGFSSITGNVSDPNAAKSQNRFLLEMTDLGRNAWYRLIYHWFSTVTFIIIPFIILGIGNLLLIHNLNKSRKQRMALTNYRTYRNCCREERITVTLIAIIIVFLICQMPTAIVLIYTSSHTPSPGSSEENILLGLGNIFNFLVAINAACNFVLYSALSAKYRQVFVGMFCIRSVKVYYQTRWNGENTISLLPIVEHHIVRYNSSMIVHPGSSFRGISSSLADKWDYPALECDVHNSLQPEDHWDIVRLVLGSHRELKEITFASEGYIIPECKPKIGKDYKTG